MTAASSDHSKPRKQLTPVADQLRGQCAGRDSRPHDRPAPDAAREQERRLLSALMDHISDNIYFKDTRSRFTLINRAMADFFNLKHPSEAIGKTDFNFFTADHAAKAFEDEQELIRTGRPVIGKEEKETWPDGHES